MNNESTNCGYCGGAGFFKTPTTDPVRCKVCNGDSPIRLNFILDAHQRASQLFEEAGPDGPTESAVADAIHDAEEDTRIDCISMVREGFPDASKLIEQTIKYRRTQDQAT